MYNIYSTDTQYSVISLQSCHTAVRCENKLIAI